MHRQLRAPHQGEENPMADNRTIVEQFLKAMAANDVEAQERLLSDDIVEEYPQSGERIRGKDNRRAIIENYPGGTPRDTSPTTPTPWTPEIIGGGDRFAVAGQITYPNGETWHAVSLIEVGDGKIKKITDYFGAPFEAPAWRAPYVEKEPTATPPR
jgi:ketosteroid isomerase-like protein